jgi:hypothetical protein
MLLGIGCFLALWGIIPFLHTPATPITMKTDLAGGVSSISECGTQEEIATVFIHGSIHVPLAFLSPFCVLYDSFNGSSWYEKTVNSLRYHITTQRDGVVFLDGLFEVTQIINQDNFEGPTRYNGACHVIRGFQRSCATISHTTRRFFTFGWSGILSEQERKSAAEDLYDALHALKLEALVRGKQLKIELYAFSHGGQIALHLPMVRKIRGDTHFIIDLVVLSAVPLWYDNARNILMGMFSKVINCYSPGDFAQTVDRFSTPEPPNQAFSDTIPLPDKKYSSLHIIDLAITLGERYAVPHCAFFHIDNLHILPCRVRRSANYKSRYEAVHKFIDLLNPLPLIVLYPYLLEPIQAYVKTTGAAYQHINLTLSGTSDSFQGTYHFYKQPEDLKVCLSWPIPDHLIHSQKELKATLAEQGVPGKISVLWHEMIHALSAFWK